MNCDSRGSWAWPVGYALHATFGRYSRASNERQDNRSFFGGWRGTSAADLGMLPRSPLRRVFEERLFYELYFAVTCRSNCKALGENLRGAEPLPDPRAR